MDTEQNGSAVARFLPKYLFALRKCASAFSFRVFRSDARLLIWKICNHYGFRSDEPTPELPEVSPDIFLNEQTAIRIVEASVADGNVTPLELAVLNAAAQSANTIFEIGTFDGRTTLNLALNAQSNARIFTLDLPPDDAACTALPLAKGDRTFIEKPESGARFKGRPEAARIVQLYGDSATFDFAQYEGQMDFVFVDGAHSFTYVLADAATALKLLRPSGGIIFFHDYGTWPGVTRALDKLARESDAFRGLRRVAGTALAFLRVERA